MNDSGVDFRAQQIQSQGILYIGERVVTTPAEAVVYDNDFTIAVDMASDEGTITFPLPALSDEPIEPGARRLRFRDKKGNAGLYNIEIVGPFVGGASSVSIDTNGGSVVIESVTDKWAVWADSAPTAGPIPYTPTTPGDWPAPPGVPTTGQQAWDYIASRLTALESVPGAIAQIYTCPMAATVRQLVYESVANTVALADASNPAKMRAIGFIASKPTATTCTIQSWGELVGFTGRTATAKQYADPAVPGGITETQPDPLVNQVQEVGFAKNSTTVVVTIIGNPPVPV